MSWLSSKVALGFYQASVAVYRKLSLTTKAKKQAGVKFLVWAHVLGQ